MGELNERDRECVCVYACVRARDRYAGSGWIRGGVAESWSHKCAYSTPTNLTFFLKLVDGYECALTMQTYR